MLGPFLIACVLIHTASSAPVAQFSAPCDAFGRIVTADYNQAGRECAELIRRSWKAIDTLGNTGEIN